MDSASPQASVFGQTISKFNDFEENLTFISKKHNENREEQLQNCAKPKLW